MNLDIYEPREDSFLIAKHIPTYAKKAKTCLDMGTGSGVLALASAKYCKVIAADINPKALAYAKEQATKAKLKIEFIMTDLFSNIPKQKFDLITLNPPYLPDPKRAELRNIALDGGKKGSELIEKFLKQAKNYLADDGTILLLFSNLSGDILKLLNKCKYKYTKLDEENQFMETLYVYALSKK